MAKPLKADCCCWGCRPRIYPPPRPELCGRSQGREGRTCSTLRIHYSGNPPFRNPDTPKKGSEEVISSHKQQRLWQFLLLLKCERWYWLKLTWPGYHSYQIRNRLLMGWSHTWKRKTPKYSCGWNIHHSETVILESLTEVLIVFFFFQFKVLILIIKGIHDVATPRNGHPYGLDVE